MPWKKPKPAAPTWRRSLKAATATSDEDEDEDSAETISLEDLKTLKADLAAAKRQLKQLETQFLDRLRTAVMKLGPESEQMLVLRILKSDLQDRLDAEVDSGRRALVERYRSWVHKYAATLRDLQARRDTAAARLSGSLEELGYV